MLTEAEVHRNEQITYSIMKMKTESKNRAEGNET